MIEISCFFLLYPSNILFLFFYCPVYSNEYYFQSFLHYAVAVIMEVSLIFTAGLIKAFSSLLFYLRCSCRALCTAAPASKHKLGVLMSGITVQQQLCQERSCNVRVVQQVNLKAARCWSHQQLQLHCDTAASCRRICSVVWGLQCGQ